MERARWSTKRMGAAMQATMLKTSDMGRELSLMLTSHSIRETGRTIKRMEMGPFSGPNKRKLSTESGTMVRKERESLQIVREK